MSEVATRWKKKPVTVEAVQLTRENARDVWDWTCEAFRSGAARDVVIDVDDGLTIKTLEGDMRAPFGHWVIRGIRGEFYPCEPGIFEATYEPAEDDDPEYPSDEDAASLDTDPMEKF